MTVKKMGNNWNVELGGVSGTRLAVLDVVRNFLSLNDEIRQSSISGLVVDVDLSGLHVAHSEIVGQFVSIQSSLVQYDGRLNLKNANPLLRGSFDVIMLDKIINIEYQDDKLNKKQDIKNN